MPAKKKATKKKATKKATKKSTTKKGTQLWCTEDLDFGEDGCLVIYNQYLAQAIQRAINDPNHEFCIEIKQPGSGDHTINAMCPC